jgi:hypothetical protein
MANESITTQPDLKSLEHQAIKNRTLEMIRDYLLTYTHNWSSTSMIRMAAFVGWMADLALMHPEKAPQDLSAAIDEYDRFVKQAADAGDLP